MCPTCWGMEPHLKKFIFSYGHLFSIKYFMGGLLPFQDEDSSIFINNPIDIAKDWDEKSKQYNMPIDGDLWKEDPPDSSFPASIAFIAAQLQSLKKGQTFLRIIREMVFVQKKNISKWKYLHIAARDAGCDLEIFKKSFEGEAREQFYLELKKIRALKIKIFPTVVLSNIQGNSVQLKGYQTFDSLEREFMQLYVTSIQRRYEKEGIRLFDNQQSLTTKEYAELKNISTDQAEKILTSYEKNKKLKSHKTKNGIIWTKNKITIIGGGISGLTLGNLLEKKKIEYEIFNPPSKKESIEKASIVSEKGIEVLQSILTSEQINSYGHKINSFKLFDEFGKIRSSDQLPNTFVFSNSKLTGLLKSAIPRAKLHMDVQLKAVINENLIVDKVLFSGLNPKTVFPEIVIVADDSKSRIREKLFPNTKLLTDPINEIVSIVESETLALSIGNTFLKYTNQEKDLVLGIVQLSNARIAWFVQFNALKYKATLDLPEDKKRFIQNKFGNWNAPIFQLIEETEFSNSFLWNENKMDHYNMNLKSNAFFLGNHHSPSLPLTSKSTTESLEDAKLFSDLITVNSIEKQSDIEYLSEQYNFRRDSFCLRKNKMSQSKELISSNELEKKLNALLGP